MFINKRLLSLISLSFVFFFCNYKAQNIYHEIRNVYESFEKNDEAALPYVKKYIEKAKRDKNYQELKQGFEDFAYYSTDKKQKLHYADSAIIAANFSHQPELISSAHLYKGSILYYYFKNHTSALDHTLIAFNLLKNNKNDYLKYKIIYQMGLVKNYLGYYEEAAKHFLDCRKFFESEALGKEEPNEIYNLKKGFLNSLHQEIVCYQKLGLHSKAHPLITLGKKESKTSKEFLKEYAYFIKCEGIDNYQNQNYWKAIEYLKQSVLILNKNRGDHWLPIAELYLGKSYLKVGDNRSAVAQFEKVDKWSKNNDFVFPELQENYNLLISYNAKIKNSDKELSYTKDLLKVKSKITQEYPQISAKVHLKYDNKIINDAKENLEIKNKVGIGIIAFLILAILILSKEIRKYNNHIEEIKKRYSELEFKLLQKQNEPKIGYENISVQSKRALPKEIFLDLQDKLNTFEENKGFTEPSLTLEILSEQLNTNKTYLSQYINEITGMNFCKYLASLRINYITQLMYEDPQYLKLKVQSLAEECGIASRANFSNLFQEFNGLRPAEFIKQRKLELKEENTTSFLSTDC